MFLRDLDDVRTLFASLKGTFLGVGMTAYSRIIPASFIQPYHIIALRKTRDLPWLRRKASVFCLEEEIGSFFDEQGFNSTRLLSHSLIRRVLKKLPEPKYFLLYQSYPEIEALARRQGWVLLANFSSLRMRVAERAYFHTMIERLKLNRIPGEIHPIGSLYDYNYEFWARKMAPRFVTHLPEILQGGGRGTFFIRCNEDYQRLRDRLRGGTWRGKSISRISIHEFMEGIPTSLALCLTRHGILFSNLQRQLIDLPYCKDISEDGVFCGHSWGENSWPSHIREEALRQARLIGEYLAESGYRGILGIDLLITKDNKKVYPLECNPRFTGAFPMLSQLHVQHNIIPMDVFHMLEFLGVPYGIDPDYLNSRYAEPLTGSHIILFPLRGEIPGGRKPIDAGLYFFDPEAGRVSFLKGATEYREIRGKGQFIITDGPLDTGKKGLFLQDPYHRLCRVLFPCPIIDEKEGLSSQALFAADWVYERMFQ